MNCPVCKAQNDQGPSCRRCKADLSLLFDLERQRAVELARAQRALAQGRWEDAIAAAGCVEELRAGGDARRVRALAHLLRRDFVSAWRDHDRARAR